MLFLCHTEYCGRLDDVKQVIRKDFYPPEVISLLIIVQVNQCHDIIYLDYPDGAFKYDQ